MLTSNRCDRFALALILIGTGAGCDESASGTGDGGAPIPATVCPWGKDFPTITLPSSEVKGVLKGASRNPSTTCTRSRGTGGPDTAFLLPITARTTVELEVISGFDTVLAIRSACDDPLTELACNDNQGVTGAGGGSGGSGGAAGGGSFDPTRPAIDAGAAPGAPVPPPAPIGDGRDARLRATLNPGTYYVLVDEAEAFGVGGAFTLKVTSSAPPPHVACAAAKTLTDGLSLPGEELDVAFEKPSQSCSGVEPRAALYYSARIPSGQRLTVRAQPVAGDREWSPVIQLLSSCNNGRCLARERVGMFGDRQLRYVNNAATAEDVIVTVGPSTTVSGGVFRLDVSLGEPVLNGSCAAARPIMDGTVLRNQDLSEGQPSQFSGCGPMGGQALFYSVTVLPQQQLSVIADSRASPGTGDPFGGKFPLFLALQSGCTQGDCRAATQGDRLDYTNNTSEPQKLILQVGTLLGLPNTVFDLMVSMPLPPGSIVVRGNGLVTTEAGGKATFEVALGAPPSAPVMIPVESDTPGEGTASPPVLTFTPENWDKPQTVTVTGADDSQRDGNRPYRILVKPAASTDPRYQGMDAEDVSATNRDNEASFTFVGANPLTTSESGNSVVLTVVANKKPTGQAVLPLSSSDTGEGTISPASLTFDASNWDKPQLVTVTGVDDKEQDGPQSYKIVTGVVTGSDPEYAGLDPEDLAALNADNEFIFVQSHPVNGDFNCFGGGFGRQVAADEVGNIHVVMGCNDPFGGGGAFPDGGVPGGGSSMGSGGSFGGRAPIAQPPPIGPSGPAAFSVVSSDGGMSFSKPRKIGIPDAGEMHVAGGPAGVAYLVAQSRSGTLFTRTEDTGKTWSTPLVLSGSEQGGGNLRLGAAGQRVVVTGFGREGATVWFSSDGGRQFQENRLGRFGSVAGLHVSAGGEVWLYLQEMVAELLKSTDGGATFTTAVSLPGGFFFDSVGFGSRTVYGTGKEPRLMVMPLSDSAMPRFIEGLSDVQRGPRSLIVDTADNLTVIDWGFMGIEVRRLAAGATTLGAPKSLGGFQTGASGTALSEKAVALAIWENGQVLVSVQTF